MYIKGKAGGQKQADPHCRSLVVVGPPCHWLMVVVPFVVGAVGWWWCLSPLVGGGDGGMGPSSPLVDGGGSVHGWLLMAICGGCWWMVVALIAVHRWQWCALLAVCGGCWWMVVVLVQCRCWALLIVCGWCCWVLDIGCLCCCWSLVAVGFQSLFVSHCCLLLSVTVHHLLVLSLSGIVSFHVVTCRQAFPLGRGNEVGS